MRMHEIDGGRRHDRRKADVLGTRDVCPARDELCHVDDVLDVSLSGEEMVVHKIEVAITVESQDLTPGARCIGVCPWDQCHGESHQHAFYG